MSINKIVSNYFQDLLDYLDLVSIQNNNSLDQYFENIQDSSKIDLIQKIAQIYEKLDTLKVSEILYWNEVSINDTWFLIIMSLTVIIISFVTLYFYFSTIKTKLIIDILKMTLIYLCLYLIGFSIMLVILINGGDSKKYNNACKEKNKDLITNLIYNKILNSYNNETKGINNLFLYIGYRIKKKTVQYKKYYNLMKSFNPPQFSNIFKYDDIQEVHKDIDYLLIYNLLEKDIVLSLENLYDNGNGYDDIYEILLLSDNIYLLNTCNKIMNYYYFITYSEHHPKKENDNKIIDKLVISQIKLLDQNYKDHIENINELYDLSGIEWQRIIQTFTFLYMECWSLYNKYHKFTINNDLKNKIHNNTYGSLQIENNECLPNDKTCMTESIDYMKKIKTYFKKIHITYFDSSLSQIENINNENDALDIIMNYQIKYKPLFIGLYNEMLKKIWNIDLFPLKYNFIYDQLMENFNSKFADMPDKYTEDFCNIILRKLVYEIYDSFNKSLTKTLINKAGHQLMKFNEINLLKHTKYIFDNIDIDFNNLSINEQRKYKEFYLNLLNKINNVIILKKQSNDQTRNNIKFLQNSDFIKVFDTVSWSDFKNGININYYSKIVDIFYKKTNDVINNKSKRISPDNIFYDQEKKLKLYLIVVIVSTIVLILGLIYFIINKLIDHPTGKNNESKYNFNNRILNYIIQIVAPAIGIFFIIILIISCYTKKVASLNFNKEIIDTNTKLLNDSLNNFNKTIMFLDQKITNPDNNVVDINILGNDQKNDIFENLKNIVTQFDKCNYLLITHNESLQFPYTEIVVNLIMVIIMIIIMIYIFNQFQPIITIINIKNLYKMKHDAEYGSNISSLSKEIQFCQKRT